MSTFTYIVNNEKVVLHSDDRLVAVRFHEPAPHSLRHSVATAAGADRFADRVELEGEKFTILALPASAEAPSRAALADAPEVVRVASVFRHRNACIIATERVIVGIKPGVSATDVAATVNGAVVDSAGNRHLIQLAPTADPLAAAQELAHNANVVYAEPDFVNIVQKLARRSTSRRVGPLDVYDGQQYAIHITQATQAWARVRGHRDIRVAVLDEGVDTTHEDLAAAVVGGYDGVDGDSWQEPNPWDGHGTACAGLVAAVHNGRGVLGIAGGCSILALRIAYSKAPGAPWEWTPWKVARAIEWAWMADAAVLSNSWGGGAPSSTVAAAFEAARTKGRGGRGCVIVAAAGNDSGPVSYPAALPGIICVTASNEFDEPKTHASRDGEHWWGSNFGPQATLAAPGVHNYTTDITGTGGYNPGPNEPGYVHDFNGTSSATPIVAGAAALVLSADPSLTEAEVRTILIETADKVGGVHYDSNGHNPRMGYGRLNVLAAVQRALASV